MAKTSWVSKVSRAIKGKKGGGRRSAAFQFILGKFKRGQLHRKGKGGAKGPVVKDRKMAIAIAYGTAQRMGFSEAEAGRLMVYRLLTGER